MHHAYLLEGPLSLFGALALSAQKLFGFEQAKEGANPDVHMYEFEKFNIDEARSLGSEASFKSVSGRALFIIGTGSISHDAQQALLKLFEEPQEGTSFVLLTPPGTLIPTLRSRFALYPEKIEEEKESEMPAKKFLASAGKERSAQIVALLKEEEGEKERVRNFLSSLEQVLYRAHSKKTTSELRLALADISLVRGYLADRSASLKMLLEHLALALPTV
ncbi:MAG: hypothetical protein V4436_01255 [Patescibacteria group bacterium]